MTKKTMPGKERSEKSDKAAPRKGQTGNYVIQLLIVILGILITFQGSALIEKRAQRREAAYILSMVKDELEKNRSNVKYQRELLEFEYAGAKAMKPYINRPGDIHADSIGKYVSVITGTKNYGFVANSFEVLKNSARFQTIGNKELLRDLFKIYEGLENFSNGINSYNSMKRTGMEDFFYSLDSDVYDAMHSRTDGPSLIFSGIMSNAAMRNYIVATAYGNNVDYLIPTAGELIEEITAIVGRIDDEMAGVKYKSAQ